MRTNDLCVASSYWYYPGFYHNGPPATRVAQRRTGEVVHASQKILVDCEAISSTNQINGGWISGQAHGINRQPVLFVDGHARLLFWRELKVDSRLTANFGWDWAGLDWADAP